MRNCPDSQIARGQRISDVLKDAKIVRLVLVLVLGAIGSIPLVFLTPPFQVPDEVQHFYRAYDLSEFRIRAEVQNGVAGATLPESLERLVKSGVYTKDGLSYPATPAPIEKTLQLASIPLDSSRRRFIAFPGSAFYSPLPYLPQVLGITVGRIFGIGPLYLLYLGRLFNCLAALGLVGLAVHLIPYSEELVVVVGLLPMSLFLYASLSPDAAVIACALLFTALSFSAGTRGSWSTWELVMAAAVGTVFCSVKPVYIPILLPGVVPGLFQRANVARVVRSHAILIAVVLGVTAGWLMFARSTMTTLLGGGHPSAQTNLVLHQPMLLVRALVHSVGIDLFLRLYFQTVGQFGWLTVPLGPSAVYLLPLVSLVIVWKLRSAAERNVLSALWQLALAISSAVLVLIAMYLMSAHVGEGQVTGVQGRYFIPMLVLAGTAVIELVPRSRRSISGWRGLASISVIIVAEIIAMDTTIIRAFQVF